MGLPASELPADLAALIRVPIEVRQVEYKQSMNWREGGTWIAVVKAALGFSNIADGGRLVLGVSEEPRGAYRADGMTQSDFDSFVQDDVNDRINEYADPSMSVRLVKGAVDGALFAVIVVPPFRELPTICKRDAGPSSELRRGAIYTRSVHKPETAEVRDQTEMREIMDRATALGIAKMRRLYPGITDAPLGLEDALRRELGGFA